MLQGFSMVFNQVLIFLLLMVVGLILGKAKVLQEDHIGGLCNLMVYVIIPCSIISSCRSQQISINLLRTMGIMLVVAFLVHFFNILVSRVSFTDLTEHSSRLCRFATIFPNAGFIGMPLVEALLGPELVVYSALFIVANNVVVWTYGLVVMTGDKRLNYRKLLLNPGLLGVVVSLLFVFFSVPLPFPVEKAMAYFANMTVPIPTIIVGYYLSQTLLDKRLLQKNILLSTVERLLLLPISEAFLASVFGLSGDLLMVVAISAAAPSAMLMTVLAQQCNCSPKLSANILSFQTILSVLTMPVVIALAKMLWA